MASNTVHCLSFMALPNDPPRPDFSAPAWSSGCSRSSNRWRPPPHRRRRYPGHAGRPRRSVHGHHLGQLIGQALHQAQSRSMASTVQPRCTQLAGKVGPKRPRPMTANSFRRFFRAIGTSRNVSKQGGTKEFAAANRAQFYTGRPEEANTRLNPVGYESVILSPLYRQSAHAAVLVPRRRSRIHATEVTLPDSHHVERSDRYRAPAGSTILDAARQPGVDIPRFAITPT